MYNYTFNTIELITRESVPGVFVLGFSFFSSFCICIDRSEETPPVSDCTSSACLRPKRVGSLVLAAAHVSMVEVQDIDEVPPEDGVDVGFDTREVPDLKEPPNPATPTNKFARKARKRKAKQEEDSDTPPETPPEAPHAQNGDTSLTTAQLYTKDGAYLAFVLAFLWILVSTLFTFSKATVAVLVETPASFVASTTRWCLKPVFATRSLLMSRRGSEKV